MPWPTLAAIKHVSERNLPLLLGYHASWLPADHLPRWQVLPGCQDKRYLNVLQGRWIFALLLALDQDLMTSQDFAVLRRIYRRLVSIQRHQVFHHTSLAVDID